MTTAAEPDATGDEVARAKPPFLKRVRIRNYKSIEFCDVSLEPLTLFVGRNASGKSNFLDALGFLSDLMDVSASEAVERRNGWRAVHYRGDTTSEIEFQIDAELDALGLRELQYSCVLTENARTREVNVVFEKLEVKPDTPEESFDYRIEKGELGPLNQKAPRTVLDYGYRTMLGAFGLHSSFELAKALRKSRLYNFAPSEMRRLVTLTGRTALSPTGENLARALRTIQEFAPATFERINRYLSSIVPEIDGASSEAVGREYLTVRAHFRSATTGQTVFEAPNLSDGTLRALAALVAVNQDELLGTPSPMFVAIEEPETALHPAAMRALVDALDEATLHTQVLLTTHSADMLDNPTIRPENVRVVQMIDGRTVIAPVDEASVEIVRRELDTLGGLERQNQLEPNIDDVERQLRLSKNGQEHKS